MLWLQVRQYFVYTVHCTDCPPVGSWQVFNGEITKNGSEDVSGARKRDIMRTMWFAKVRFY